MALKLLPSHFHNAVVNLPPSANKRKLVDFVVVDVFPHCPFLNFFFRPLPSGQFKLGKIIFRSDVKATNQATIFTPTTKLKRPFSCSFILPGYCEIMNTFDDFAVRKTYQIKWASTQQNPQCWVNSFRVHSSPVDLLLFVYGCSGSICMNCSDFLKL